MKVKLLKKVRNRFSIMHHPKGVVHFNRIYNYNLFQLIDKNSSQSHFCQCGRIPGNGAQQYCSIERIFETKKECVDFLKSVIIQTLKEEGHRNNKVREVVRSSKKVWYV